MIAGLRGLGLPASYVSGYIRTIPPPGKPRLQGADATHAWVSVWGGVEIGWLGVDPTNAIDAGNDHILLAIGRDFSDVSPVHGMFVGSGAQELEVGVMCPGAQLPPDKYKAFRTRADNHGSRFGVSRGRFPVPPARPACP